MIIASRRRLLRLVSALALFGIAAPVVNADLQGDEAAIGLANKMVAAMGGKEIWANAVWMHVKERSHAPNQRLPLAHEAWRGLQVPKARYTTENADVSYRQAWDTKAGWRVLNGDYLQFDEDRHGGEVDFWHREIYTMYHRFAAGDEALKLTSTGERGFKVEHAETGAPLGTFTVSADGGILVWSSGSGEDDVTYVYGPLKSFGAIKLPAWGAQTNGGWRFNYLDATLHTSQMPDDLMKP